jgi:hypothetical protein
VREGDNGIYLGIVCIMISIIIYFLDITTQWTSIQPYLSH